MLFRSLDQPTSGVVAFARSRAAWSEARREFKAARVAKHYLAVCDRVSDRWPPELPADGLRGWIETAAPLTDFADRLAPLLGDRPEQPLVCVRIRAAIGRDGLERSAVRLDGRRASTVVQPLASHGDRWLVRLLLETGCRHQARVHLAWIGLPIVGDRVYGRPTSDSDRAAIRLHAFAIDLSVVSPDEAPVFAPPAPDFWSANSSTPW